MALDVHDRSALIDAVTVGAEQPIAVLVGSPLSWDAGGGVPGVREMLDVARDLIRARLSHRLADFETSLVGLSGSAAYQQAMSWLHGSLTQAGVNEVIRRAVLRARQTGRADDFQGDGVPADWYLPRGTRALGSLFARGDDRFPGPILTTNFDPLISLSIRAAGGVRRLRVIDADGGLPRTVETDPGEIDVVHLHGYWKGANTLHTPAQLTSHRPRLAASLRRMLSRCTLVVIGYGGWDDVFTAALVDALNDQDARLTVLWCFREADGEEIERLHGRILGRLGLAITSGNLHIYGGIDCHSIFEEIVSAVPGVVTPADQVVSPLPGWQVVDSTFLGNQPPLNREDALRFFDGSPPAWRHVVSTSIPKRRTVARIMNSISGVTEDRSSVTLIRAAGGEGKTTTLLQCAVHAALSADWTVLYRPNPLAPLSVDVVASLDPSQQWLLIIDEADGLAQAIFECVRALHNLGHANVDFLIAARDSDWRASRADAWPWNQVCLRLDDIYLRGIDDDEDAGLLVDAWAAFGEAGLRGLDAHAGRSERIAALRRSARNHLEVVGEDGSLLGALLETRFSEPALRAHVRTVLSRLSEVPVGTSGLTLGDAFVYVAACHSAGVQGLDLNVLADLLGVPRAWVRTRVLSRLGEEAAVVSSGDRAFTRHHRVADAVVSEAEHSLGIDIGETWARLISQVVSTSREIQVSYHTHSKVLHVGPRLQSALPSNIAKERRAAIAIAAALASCKSMPERLECIVDLCTTYRSADKHGDAVQVFYDNLAAASGKVDFAEVVRGYWYEWSVCFGDSSIDVQSAASNAFLAGVSLSDAIGKFAITSERLMRSCSGLGLSLGRLADSERSAVFGQGRSASAWIGRYSKPDRKTQAFLRQHEDASARAGVPAPSGADEAIAWLRDAVLHAKHLIVDQRFTNLCSDEAIRFQLLKEGLRTGFPAAR